MTQQEIDELASKPNILDLSGSNGLYKVGNGDIVIWTGVSGVNDILKALKDLTYIEIDEKSGLKVWKIKD